MDWNDWLTIFFGVATFILTIIQIYQAIPKMICLDFSEIIFHDNGSWLLDKTCVRTHFMIENLHNKDTTFTIVAYLRIKSKDRTYTEKATEEINKIHLKFKEPSFNQLFFYTKN